MRPPPLVALTPGDLDARAAPTWLAAAAAVFECGWRGLVLREATLSDREYLELARRLRAAWPRERAGWLCVHDRAHLAAAVDADALALGGASLAPEQVRAWLAPGLSLGLSTHAEDSSERWRGADWIVHGPVQRTSKPGAREPIGWDGLRRAVQRAAAPVWALGGLTPQHVAQVRACGAAGLAVLSGVFKAPDPRAAASAYLDAWRAWDGA